MLNYKNNGYTINIKLPEECGHTGYSIECTYKYDKKEEKYLLSMWLVKERFTKGERFKIDSQEVDTQYISSSKNDIKQNICRIVEWASLSGFFDYYIEKYEYTHKCFDIGDNLLSKDEVVCERKDA